MSEAAPQASACTPGWPASFARRHEIDTETAMATEYGWLIENGKHQGDGLAYRYINNDNGGVPDWTEDPNKALRFARREDAEQFAYHDEDAWRIVQHAWDDMPANAEVSR